MYMFTKNLNIMKRGLTTGLSSINYSFVSLKIREVHMFLIHKAIFIYLMLWGIFWIVITKMMNYLIYQNNRNKK